MSKKQQDSTPSIKMNPYGSQHDMGLDTIAAYLKQDTSSRQGRAIPPLEKWHPQRSGKMDLVIKANGEWWHEGSKIARQSLIDLFATVLWREGSDDAPVYYLKTPVEKFAITVEDVPFFITDVNIIVKDDVQTLEFISSTGDVIELNEEHPLHMRQYQGEDRPYIEVRFGMQGLISRNVLMHLIQLGELKQQHERTYLILYSGGQSYSLSVPN